MQSTSIGDHFSKVIFLHIDLSIYLNVPVIVLSFGQVPKTDWTLFNFQFFTLD